MARSRTIKPTFFTNEELAELSIPVRLFFIGLWGIADREGRLENRPKRIKREVFPYDPDVTEEIIVKWLAELSNHASRFVALYEVDGSKYVQVKNFKKHQDIHPRETASVIPGQPKARPGQPNPEPAVAGNAIIPLPSCTSIPSLPSGASGAQGRDPSPTTTERLAPSLHGEEVEAAADAKRDIENRTPSPVVEVQRAALAALQSQPEAQPKIPIAYDWLRSFQIAHRNKFEKDYGHGEQDAKATGRLSELLESLPLAERLSDWERRREIFSEFLGRTDARTQSAGWSFAFFVQDFRALAIPVDKRPKPLEKPQFGPRPAARPTQYAKV